MNPSSRPVYETDQYLRDHQKNLSLQQRVTAIKIYESMIVEDVSKLEDKRLTELIGGECSQVFDKGKNGNRNKRWCLVCNCLKTNEGDGFLKHCKSDVRRYPDLVEAVRVTAVLI